MWADEGGVGGGQGGDEGVGRGRETARWWRRGGRLRVVSRRNSRKRQGRNLFLPLRPYLFPPLPSTITSPSSSIRPSSPFPSVPSLSRSSCCYYSFLRVRLSLLPITVPNLSRASFRIALHRRQSYDPSPFPCADEQEREKERAGEKEGEKTAGRDDNAVALLKPLSNTA